MFSECYGNHRALTVVFVLYDVFRVLEKPQGVTVVFMLYAGFFVMLAQAEFAIAVVNQLQIMNQNKMGLSCFAIESHHQ